MENLPEIAIRIQFEENLLVLHGEITINQQFDQTNHQPLLAQNRSLGPANRGPRSNSGIPMPLCWTEWGGRCRDANDADFAGAKSEEIFVY